MKFITLQDLSKTIRTNFTKIPHDIDFVLGVARSGMLPATMISEFLNIPLTDVDSFCSGAKPTGGLRLGFKKFLCENGGKDTVLVVDDTIFNGNSIKTVRSKLKPFEDKCEFIFLAVYKEGRSNDVDIFLEDVSNFTEGFTQPVLYEWNVFHHYGGVMEGCIYDCDGVLCSEPPDERNEKQYLEYIKNAKPMFIPSNVIGAVVSYRLAKNELITREWLDKAGVRTKRVVLFPASTWEERNRSGITPGQFKGRYYSDSPWAKLFIESDESQAKEIARISHKPVYCVSTNALFQ